MEKRKIKEIRPKNKIPYAPKKLRVCAYVRVSTNSSEQLDSLKNQTEYYQRKLSANPEYEFCGIFSDAGISGAKENRPGFQAMIEKARSGDVDLIITKSISRFARNTLMLLKYVRELKEIGIGVIFEEQNINTLSGDGELMLTVLSSVAEEERKSISETMKMSKRNRFKTGNCKVNVKKLLGYKRNKQGDIVIDDKEAAIVRQIYKMYLEGKSASQIAKELNSESDPSYPRPVFNNSRIIRTLSNEKYCGDLLMQKNYIDQSGKEKRNRGELPQYYIQNNHPGIISRRDWDRAQDIRKSRANRYPFSRLLKCPYCGASLVHFINKRWVYWCCNTQMEYTKAACKGISVPERKILELHEKTPITEPMVVLEVRHEKNSNGGTKKDFCLVPAAQYSRRQDGP